VGCGQSRSGALGAVAAYLAFDDTWSCAQATSGEQFEDFPASVNLLPLERSREAMEDDELIAAMVGGDDTALRELFERHAPWLAARLRPILPAAEVEDVLQESFLAVWRGARGYRPEGSPGGWLWGITRRQAALWLRRRGPDGCRWPPWPARPAAALACPGVTAVRPGLLPRRACGGLRPDPAA
jgi:hypothetical protein